MTKEELKQLVKTALQKKIQSKEVDLPGEGEHEIPKKFPTVEETLVKLMTEQYPLFVEDIWWVAPKPTTFRVKFKNGESFFLIKTDTDWIAQIQGKKYYLPSLQDEQRATEAIADMLKYGAPPKGTGEGSAPPAGEGGTSTEFPAPEETPPVEAPAEETPPVEA